MNADNALIRTTAIKCARVMGMASLRTFLLLDFLKRAPRVRCGEQIKSHKNRLYSLFN